MSVATPETIAEHVGLTEKVAARAAKRLAQAEVHARAAISDDVYDAIDTDPAHANRAVLVEAESLLCLYYALPILNMQFGELGSLVKAVGFEESRTEAMSKRELDSYRAEILGQALSLLATIASDPLAGAGIHLASV